MSHSMSTCTCKSEQDAYDDGTFARSYTLLVDAYCPTHGHLSIIRECAS